MGIVNNFRGLAFARENPVEGSLKGAGVSWPYAGAHRGCRIFFGASFRKSLTDLVKGFLVRVFARKERGLGSGRNAPPRPGQMIPPLYHTKASLVNYFFLFDKIKISWYNIVGCENFHKLKYNKTRVYNITRASILEVFAHRLMRVYTFQQYSAFNHGII